MKRHALDGCRTAYGRKFKFHDENILMLSWYSRRIIKSMQRRKVRSCLSLGIGHTVVAKKIIEELAPSLDRYLILEGSSERIESFRKKVSLPENVFIIHSLFERFNTEDTFDAIEMGFVLEHVERPLYVLKKYTGFLRPRGSLFLAVPNAASLHRIVGYEAGMLNDLHALSDHDMELGHKRYFDLKSLSKIVRSSGLKVIRTEGVFLKPFSSSQLKSLRLSPEVFGALCSAGVNYPEISNAIYLETAR